MHLVSEARCAANEGLLSPLLSLSLSLPFYFHFQFVLFFISVAFLYVRYSFLLFSLPRVQGTTLHALPSVIRFPIQRKRRGGTRMISLFKARKHYFVMPSFDRETTTTRIELSLFILLEHNLTFSIYLFSLPCLFCLCIKRLQFTQSQAP